MALLTPDVPVPTSDFRDPCPTAGRGGPLDLLRLGPQKQLPALPSLSPPPTPACVVRASLQILSPTLQPCLDHLVTSTLVLLFR